MVNMVKDDRTAFPPMKHQTATVEHLRENPLALITSDAGTGKTRCVLDFFLEEKEKNPDARMIVFAPLSILQPAWGDDINRWTPELSYSIAYNANRAKALSSDADIILTNHDAVKSIWSKEELKKIFSEAGFTHMCIDEFTAYKNRTSQRGKAMYQIARKIPNRIIMSGTPDTNGILDMWHPMMILDNGERLGTRFFKFREEVCTPRFNGYANVWTPKDMASGIVAQSIDDINIRFELEDCVDMPARSQRTVYVELPKKARKAYDELKKDSLFVSDSGELVKVNHAGTLVKKLLQICTGAAYDADGNVVSVHKERYDLAIQLVKERKSSLVAFNYRHERDYLVSQAEKEGLTYGVIDGTTPVAMRVELVNAMQAGKLQVIFGQPQSMSHGLTLTAATAVIWCSPTYNAEHYVQFNARVYRKGQTQKSEVIRIAANNTWEPAVYAKLDKKVDNMAELLALLK